MSAPIQIIGGAFQDSEGNPLNYGYLILSLSDDSQANGNTQVGAGREVKVLLDASGNVQTSPSQAVWPNDVLIPNNNYYEVSVYSAQGQLVWGPNAQRVLSTSSPFNLGTWTPGIVTLT